jgi:hypothetical protein
MDGNSAHAITCPNKTPEKKIKRYTLKSENNISPGRDSVIKRAYQRGKTFYHRCTLSL